MTIVFSTLVSRAQEDGLFNYIVYLLKALEKCDIQNRYIILVNKEFDKRLKFKNSNFRKVIINIPDSPKIIRRPLYFFWQTFLMPFKIKENIDLLHLPNPIPFFNIYNIKTVVTIHDMAEYHGMRYNYFHRLYRKIAYITCIRASKSIITVSKFSKNEIANFLKISKDKIKVTSLGSSFFKKKLKSAINENIKTYYLHFGSNLLYKNTDRVIKSYMKNRKDYSIKLYIIGDYKELNFTDNERFQLEKKGVLFIGYISKKALKDYYLGALALIYPSFYEGFGLPILEAMSLGVPVITSNRTSMPEVAGNAALYVNPESESEIAEAMGEIALNEKFREYMVEEGYKQSKKYNWNKTAIKTLNVYEKAHF